MFHCRSFFGLRLHLLRFGWPVYDQRAAGDWASYTSVQMDGDMLGYVGWRRARGNIVWLKGERQPLLACCWRRVDRSESVGVAVLGLLVWEEMGICELKVETVVEQRDWVVVVWSVRGREWIWWGGMPVRCREGKVAGGDESYLMVSGWGRESKREKAGGWSPAWRGRAVAWKMEKKVIVFFFRFFFFV